jgi:GT2 family glycosyltransferase
MNKQYFFITVNYNNFAHTIKYVESINSQNYKNVSIIIVDNDSNHKDVEELSSALANINNVTILKNSENVGYFRGLNIGLVHVKKVIQDFENVLVVVSNNDLTFGAGFVRNLDEYSYDENDFSIVPDIVDNDGLHQNPLFISRVSGIRRFGYALYLKIITWAECYIGWHKNIIP